MNNNIDISFKMKDLLFDNPIFTASGTFGFGHEFDDFIDISKIGGVVVKGLTLEPRKGNKLPRIAETASGMLNSVGLENPGVNKFIEETLPRLKEKKVKVIANIAGNTIDEYCKMAEIVNTSECDAVEMNISCPNVKQGGVAFGTNPDVVYEITKQVRACLDKPLIVKLSPNVTDIKEIAVKAEEGGADCISLINTLIGMAVDIKTKKPILNNVIGGLSGPAIKPVALRLIWETSKVVNIPIIGMGGVRSIEDVIEFMLVGASAVAIGTSNFVNPKVTVELVEELREYLKSNKYTSCKDIIGKLKLN
ncbi:dihydroorotate dehydrogenase [Abyssisolibacter fermentans]|uniref:dihydroorotate dehydrogenase n=1 Tax=Abyssisolibacter fermentans TaxID=1766203 RepID=UPI00082B9BD4|nr:dihydroorotate dehydrogenase [Abyssisolibacter fermentans]